MIVFPETLQDVDTRESGSRMCWNVLETAGVVVDWRAVNVKSGGNIRLS